MNLTRDRFLYLDALRGIAAMCVVLYHYFPGYNAEFGHTFSYPDIFKYGYFGVELFFLISGFVIFYTLSKTNSIKSFFLKRAIRLYPAFWICLIFTFILMRAFPLSESSNVSIKEGLFGMTMANGLFKIKSIDPSYWTLLIEWFFYIMLAIVMVPFKMNEKKFHLFLWSWIALILFYNLVYHLPGIGAFFNLQYGAFFISGICCYQIYIAKKLIIPNAILLLASFIVNIIVFYSLEDSIYAISIVYIIFLSAVHFKFSFLSNKIFIFFGEISYALYLIHQNVGFIIMRGLEHLGILSIWKVIIALTIIIGLATFITRKLEKPISIMSRKLLNVY